MVHTSTYQYMVVQHGTGQYENSSYVQGGMQQYIPVQAFNKTCDFPTNPERFRRDKIKVVQLLCIGYNVTMAIFKTTQVQLFQSTYWYILVHTGIYLYIVEKNGKLHLIMCSPPSGAYESAQISWLGPSSQISSLRQSPPQSDHPGVACHGQSSTAKVLLLCTSMYMYKYVYIGMYQHVLACTSMYLYCAFRHKDFFEIHKWIQHGTRQDKAGQRST